MDQFERGHETSRSDLSELFKPANLLKTISSQIPLASAGVEMLNQIHGARLEARVNTIEQEMTAKSQIAGMEAAAQRNPPPPQDWPSAVSEYLSRTVDLVVFYDGGYHSPAEQGRELFCVVGHGALVAENEVLTAGNAWDLAQEVATHTRGCVALLLGLARYQFVPDPVDKQSGLVLLRLKNQDERYKKLMEKHGITPPVEPPKHPVSYSLTPWMGQEIGFVHNGEADDAMHLYHFSSQQFEVSVVSHFLKIREDRVMAFVTGVLSGRVQYAGSPVFSRSGVLLGIISDSIRYPSDTGIRVVARPLLCHPRFKKSEK